MVMLFKLVVFAAGLLLVQCFCICNRLSLHFSCFLSFLCTCVKPFNFAALKSW